MADVPGLQRESLDLSMSTRICEVSVLTDRVTVGLAALSHLSRGGCVCVCAAPGHPGG